MYKDTEHWEWHEGNGPVIGVALHAGHNIHNDLRSYLLIDDATRLREEDPYTDIWARHGRSWIVIKQSRFAVDLNRPLETAFYLTSDQSWGHCLWSEDLPPWPVAAAHQQHNRFYHTLDCFLTEMESRFGHFVLLDIHSYNHRRAGPAAPPADPEMNPDLNVGTGSMDRMYWAPIVDQFIKDFQLAPGLKGPFDVRENVNFRGRYLAEHVHRRFPTTGCVLALEFKKNFMDEWTGVADETAVALIGKALDHAINGIEETLGSHYEKKGRHAG